MPIYNGIEFINDSITSIITQTFDDWELIIGINGHPENSDIFKTAKLYELTDPRIKVYDLLNIKGKSNALNKMVGLCKYNYIALLDVDDIWYYKKLEIQSKFINEYDVVGSNCIWFGDINNIVPKIPLYDISNFKNSGHGRLFFSAYSLWNENKIFGVGLKNYRIICDPSSFNQYTNQKEICSTHPHNFLAEILVETGVFGLFFLTFFLFNVLRFILLNLKNIQNKEYNSIIYGSLFVILIYIWPIRSSGSFFSTWNASFFWFNFGLALFFSRKASN